MKYRLIIVSVIVSLSLAAMLARSVYQRNMAIAGSSDLVMTVTPEVLSGWDPQIIRQHAVDELLENESAEATQRFFTPLSRRLGTLQEIYDIQYEVDMPAWWQVNGLTTASYNMLARFESEVATIRISLVRQQGRWLITEFSIQPPAIPA